DWSTFTYCCGGGSLLRTITRVIAETTSARSPGRCTSLITSPSVKGPFWRRFRRISFDRLDLLLVILHASSLLGRVLPGTFLVSRVPRVLPPIHQKAGPQPVFGHRSEKKDA